jgi:hypothetical protein
LRFRPLLEVAEGGDAAVGAADEQLAVEHALEVEASYEVGEGEGHVVAGAGVEAAGRALGARLDADAVPFPFGGEVGGVEAVEVGVLQRVGEHHGAEGAGGERGGSGASALQPGEEGEVGRGLAMPELLDGGDVGAAEVGQGLLGEAGGDAGAQVARDELEERVARGGVEAVEQALHHLRGLATGGGAQRLHHGAEGGVVGLRVGGPDQGDGLGEVADVVVAEGEKLRVHALGDEGAEHGGLDGVEGKVAGDGGEAPAAVGVGRVAEVVPEEAQLAQPRGREGQAVEKGGEAAHRRRIGRRGRGAKRRFRRRGAGTVRRGAERVKRLTLLDSRRMETVGDLWSKRRLIVALNFGGGRCGAQSSGAALARRKRMVTRIPSPGRETTWRLASAFPRWIAG